MMAVRMTVEMTMVDRMTQVEMTVVVQTTQEIPEAMTVRAETRVPTLVQKQKLRPR